MVTLLKVGPATASNQQSIPCEHHALVPQYQRHAAISVSWGLSHSQMLQQIINKIKLNWKRNNLYSRNSSMDLFNINLRSSIGHGFLVTSKASERIASFSYMLSKGNLVTFSQLDISRCATEFGNCTLQSNYPFLHQTSACDVVSMTVSVYYQRQRESAWLTNMKFPNDSFIMIWLKCQFSIWNLECIYTYWPMAFRRDTLKK